MSLIFPISFRRLHDRMLRNYRSFARRQRALFSEVHCSVDVRVIHPNCPNIINGVNARWGVILSFLLKCYDQ